MTMSAGVGDVAGPPGAERPVARLLLAEDDPQLSEMLVELLSGEGYLVDAVRDGQSALQQALTGSPEVALLDRGLPHVDGLDLVVRLRRAGWSTPVLVLSAYGTARDRVEGLDAGAEDYLAKPFDVEELLARLRALLRRPLSQAETLPVPASGVGRVDLSARETALLAVLAGRPLRVFAREELRGQVFPEAEASNVVDTYVHYLRRKLGRDVVRTVHGVGYQLGRRDAGGQARPR